MIANSLLSIGNVGRNCLNEFETRMVSNQSKAFFDAIKRNKQPTFLASERKVKIKSDSNKEVRIEKDVLGTLLAEANKTERVIDIDKVLTYPLSPVCAPLSNVDDNRRKTKKSDLFSVLDNMEVETIVAHQKCKTYMIDLAAYVRSVITHCKTVRDISNRLLSSIP